MHCSFFAVTIARPFGALLQVFVCFAPLWCLERPVSLVWILFFCFISFYRVFFVGTRGYVRQRRVITLNKTRPEESPGFCPNGRGLQLNRKAENARDAYASIDNISCPLGSFLRDRMKRISATIDATFSGDLLRLFSFSTVVKV